MASTGEHETWARNRLALGGQWKPLADIELNLEVSQAELHMYMRARIRVGQQGWAPAPFGKYQDWVKIMSGWTVISFSKCRIWEWAW